jgi:adenylosuccinate synthase
VLFREIDGLEARGVDTDKLVVSANAHIIAPYNRTLDKVTERFLGSRKIGTTGRGIGPTYADKMSATVFASRTSSTSTSWSRRSRPRSASRTRCSPRSTTGGRSRPTEVVAELLSYAERLAPMVADTSLLLEQALDAGKNVLLEAGQATLLDVDHGTYPFVTSSSATAGGACTGLRHPADPGLAGHRDPQGLHDPRRRGALSPPSFSTTTASSCARPAPSTARPPAARAAAAGWTP